MESLTQGCTLVMLDEIWFDTVSIGNVYTFSCETKGFGGGDDTHIRLYISCSTCLLDCGSSCKNCEKFLISHKFPM